MQSGAGTSELTRVNLLGPVDLVVDGTKIAIGRRRVRQLLAILAAASPRSVSADSIVDFMWDGAALPADPLATVRVVVSRLRRLLPDPSALEQSAGSYSLKLPTDIMEHTELLHSAESAPTIDERINALERALLLWRSSRPFGEHSDGAALRAILHQLLEERTIAQQRLGEALLEAGRPAAAIKLLGPLLVEQPHRELLAVTLATALAQEGRKQEGLQTLSMTRRHLRSEFGLEPSAAVAEIEARILDGLVDVSPRSTTPPGASPLPFVGRTAELEALLSAPPGLTVVLGEPGAGKSALLAQVAAATEASGRRVVHVTVPASPQTPTEVPAALVSALASRISADTLPAHRLAALRRVAPAVFGDTLDQSLTRELLIEEIGAALEHAASADEVVIMVDDVQWIDRLSVAVLDRALQGNVRLLLFGRTVLGAHLEALLASSEATMIELDSLTLDDVSDVVRTRLRYLDVDTTARTLTRRTGGNPLLLSLLVDLLEEGSGDDAQLPSDVLAAVQQRLEVLSRRARETVQVAAAFLEPFSPALLEALRPSGDADLAEAQEARLLRFDRDTNRWDFAHQLIAEGAYQLLPEGRRIGLHDEIGRLIEEAGGTSPEYAVHAGHAAEIDPLRAVVTNRDAAHLFAQAFEWDTALVHLTIARGHFADAGLDSGELDASLQIAQGTALRSMGQAGHEDLLVRGARLALDADNAPLAAQALIELCGEGRINESDVRHEPIAQLLGQTLASPLSVSVRAELLSVGSTLYLISDEHLRAREMYRESLDLSAHVDDVALEGRILSRINTSLPHPGDFGMRMMAAERLREIATVDSTHATDSAIVRLGVSITAGDRGGAEAAIEALRTAVSSRNTRNRQAALCRGESSYAKFVGDFARAEAFAERLLGLERQTVSPQWTLVAYAGLIVAVRESQGRLAELLGSADALAGQYPDFLPWRMMATACAASGGDVARVQRDVADYKRDEFGGLHYEVSWWAGLALMSEAVAMAGDPEAAAIVYQELLPQSGLFVWNGASVQRPADHSLSVLARAVGDEESASRHADLAAALVAKASGAGS